MALEMLSIAMSEKTVNLSQIIASCVGNLKFCDAIGNLKIKDLCLIQSVLLRFNGGLFLGRYPITDYRLHI